MIHDSTKSGFTLIEVLIYISIFAVVGGLLVEILISSLRINTESQSTRVVSEEGRFVVETVKRLITESSLIDMSTTTAQGTLILRMNDYQGNRDFVHVYASGTKIYVAEGIIGDDGASSTCPSTNTPVCSLNALTDNKVSVDSPITFRRFSNAPGQDTVQIDFTLSYVAQNPMSQFSKAFRTSIGRVNAAVFDSNLLPNGSALTVGVDQKRWSEGYFSGLLDVGGSLTVGANLLKVNTTNNKVGIGIAIPTKALQVANGDIYVSGPSGNVILNGGSIILKSSGGICWGITVTDAGGIATSSATCP